MIDGTAPRRIGSLFVVTALVAACQPTGDADAERANGGGVPMLATAMATTFRC